MLKWLTFTGKTPVFLRSHKSIFEIYSLIKTKKPYNNLYGFFVRIAELTVMPKICQISGF